MHKLGN